MVDIWAHGCHAHQIKTFGELFLGFHHALGVGAPERCLLVHLVLLRLSLALVRLSLALAVVASGSLSNG